MSKEHEYTRKYQQQRTKYLLATKAINTLVEVNSVRYDESLSTEKKVEKMIARTGNPYFRRSGNSKIKISFSNNGENLKDNYIAMLVNA